MPCEFKVTYLLVVAQNQLMAEDARMMAVVLLLFRLFSAELQQHQSESTSVDPNAALVRGEFEALARKPVTTAEERYSLLEARDKYFRLTTDAEYART